MPFAIDTRLTLGPRQHDGPLNRSRITSIVRIRRAGQRTCVVVSNLGDAWGSHTTYSLRSVPHAPWGASNVCPGRRLSQPVHPTRPIRPIRWHRWYQPQGYRQLATPYRVISGPLLISQRPRVYARRISAHSSRLMRYRCSQTQLACRRYSHQLPDVRVSVSQYPNHGS